MIPNDCNNPEKIQSALEALTQDKSLFLVTNVGARVRTLRLIERVNQLVRLHRRDRRWGKFLPAIAHLAQSLGQALQEADDQFFHQLRADIRAGSMKRDSLRRLLDQYTDYQPGMAFPDHGGYEGLDYVVARLTGTQQVPQATCRLDIEMVAYEPAPASVILNLIDCVGFEPGDRFYDLGAGPGRVAILVRLLAETGVTGVEIEPAYCAHARQQAAHLGLSDLDFIQADARAVDYSDGTVFFLFTPFTGTVLRAVLSQLERIALSHPIRLCTYGSCTFPVNRRSWLRRAGPARPHQYKLAIFESL